MRSRTSCVVVLAGFLLGLASLAEASPPCVHCNGKVTSEDYGPNLTAGHSDHRSWIIVTLPLDASSTPTTQRFDHCVWIDGDNHPHHSKARQIYMSAALHDSLRFTNNSADTAKVEFLTNWPFSPMPLGGAKFVIVPPHECTIPYVMHEHGSSTAPKAFKFQVTQLKRGHWIRPTVHDAKRPMRPTEVGPSVVADG